METIQLSNGAHIDIYPSNQTKFIKYLLYFHGGGLVYGSRHDIPTPLINLFQQQGYTVLALDYRLAPNHPLDEIIQSVYSTFMELYTTVIHQRPFAFCGRSAGSYLAMLLTNSLLVQEALKPEFIVNFYGYTDLFFIHTERKLSLVSISKNQVKHIDTTSPIWNDTYLQRAIYYHYLVEHQAISEAYQITTSNESHFRLTPEQLVHFPPIFSSASVNDSEVPFSYSKKLSKSVPNSKFVAIYDLHHDFLKETDDPQVKKLFIKLSHWLANNSLASS